MLHPQHWRLVRFAFVFLALFQRSPGQDMGRAVVKCEGPGVPRSFRIDGQAGLITRRFGAGCKEAGRADGGGGGGWRREQQR